MANCNECKNLKTKVELEEDCKYTNHICKKYKESVRYTPKRYKGFIWPCSECKEEDFVKKG